MAQPLMPKATAVWLIDNTSLSFEQIAEFCGIHVLEVSSIADGEVAQGIRGLDPISTGLLSRAEIARCQNDPTAPLKSLKRPVADLPDVKPRGSRYTPISKRQDKPDAINWLLRHHPELSDNQLVKLVGTTKTTISAVRDRTHWNSANLRLVDPVVLGLCTQIELDTAVQKANASKPTQTAEAPALSPLEMESGDSTHDNKDDAFASSLDEQTTENAKSEAMISAENLFKN
jgi:hypothetical protein